MSNYQPDLPCGHAKAQRLKACEMCVAYDIWLYMDKQLCHASTLAKQQGGVFERKKTENILIKKLRRIHNA